MPKQAVLTEYTLSLPNLPGELTVALVADIHERRADDVAALLEQARPDLITVAGDTFERFRYEEVLNGTELKRTPLRRTLLIGAAYVNYSFINTFGRSNRPQTENAYAFLRRATKVAPVFLSLGNHEKELNEDDLAVLRENGVTLLDNADVFVTIKGCPLHIGGLSSTPDEEWLERFVHQDGFKLLLCHHPERYDDIPGVQKADLIVSGHNHGGQIRLFGRGLLSSGVRLLPRYHRGVFHGRMAVSAGCSNTVAFPRVGNPRELVVLHLKPVK